MSYINLLGTSFQNTSRISRVMKDKIRYGIWKSRSGSPRNPGEFLWGRGILEALRLSFWVGGAGALGVLKAPGQTHVERCMYYWKLLVTKFFGCLPAGMLLPWTSPCSSSCYRSFSPWHPSWRYCPRRWQNPTLPRNLSYKTRPEGVKIWSSFQRQIIKCETFVIKRLLCIKVISDLKK